MFTNTKAFSGFSVDSIEKARQFYGQVLQLKITDKMMGLIELNIAGGTNIIIYPKPNHTPATFTILNFPVDNIDTAVEDLKKHGVVFEQYDMPNLKTDEKGISRRDRHAVAWFKDPAGNILSVIEDRK